MADDETMRALEHEMGVLVRRIRRLIAERARMVHPDLSPVAYSMLMALNESGPRRASDLVDLFSIDKGAVSRQVRVAARARPDRARPRPRGPPRGDPRDHRGGQRAGWRPSRRLRRSEVIERLAGWSDEDLQAFVSAMARYNSALE